MESVVPGRGHRDQPFTIHEDAPSTADTEMLESASPEDDDNVEQMDDMADDMEGADDEDQESDYSASSDDEVVEDPYVLQDMEKLQNSFPGFREKYRLIKRIGEGMRNHFTMYLAWQNEF
jgi:AAA ATPase containing von Willebrand factor type A (vWA) domain